MTMSDLSVVKHAVEKLTRPWSDVLSPDETGLDKYIPVDYPPLLDMLDEACRSNMGERSHGSGTDPASRSLLDLEAHALRERIDGTVRTWIGQLSRQRPERDLKAAVTQLAGVLQAHQAAGTITDAEHDRITGFFPRWCEQVWRIFMPPVVKELKGACPNPDCEQASFTDGDGSVGSALIAFYVPNTGQVRAKCRACSWEWQSLAELRLLGQSIGASQDDDFLRAAGL